MACLQTLIFLLFGVAFVCAGVIRNNRDVESFADFLERSVDGKYDELLTPELAELQNVDERSGKFEGDIVLTPEQIKIFVDDYAGKKNSIRNASMLWPDKTLYYITTGLSAVQVTLVEAALAEISRVSCVKFQKRTTQTNYVNVLVAHSGCSSRVGMIGGEQVINLGIKCFEKHGTIMHEFLHALGFFHMHSTYNRDHFVIIVKNKIKKEYMHNFHRYKASQVTNHKVPYDYGSVLHYSEYASSIDGSRTIIPRRRTNETLGQRIRMSNGDISKLRSQYKC